MKDICQTRLIYSHTVYSTNFFKRSTTYFWLKNRRHRPVIVPILAATSRMNPRPILPKNPHVQKQCTLSRRVPHTRRGSYPLRSESMSRNTSQRRSSSAQSPITIGQGPNEPWGFWVSTLMDRTLTGVALKIQLRLRPWGPSRTYPVAASTP